MIDERYIKNLDEIFSENLQNLLLTKTIAIIGCGAQGGYIAEFIARLGVKKILLWDGDIYIRSNLNRQIGCLENNIGDKKSNLIESRIKAINSSIDVLNYPWFFGTQKEDCQQLLQSDFIFLSFDDSQDIKQARNMIRQVILKGIPALDCPNNLLGGFISINTNKDLSHFDLFTDILQNQKETNKKNYQGGFSTAYKCAIMAAEAVNCMVQYFNQDRFAPVDSTLNIDIYHHTYDQCDKYGKF